MDRLKSFISRLTSWQPDTRYESTTDKGAGSETLNKQQDGQNRTEDDIDDSTNELECRLCLQRYECMVDPRCLPCDHTSCLPCLEGSYDTLRFVQCGYCSKSFASLDLKCLPKVPGETGIVNYTALGGKLSNIAQVPCDACPDEIGQTEKYCENCEKHFCCEHLEVHRQLFKDEHSLIDVADVQKREPRNVVERCQQHTTDRLTLACSDCASIFCVNCPTDAGCEYCDDEPHTILSVERLASEYRLELGDMVKTLSDKISAIYKAEKENWRKLDSVEQKVKDMYKRVDNFYPEQITEIRSQKEKLKHEISGWPEECLQRVEKNTALKLVQIDDLEKLRHSITEQLAHSNQYEVVLNYWNIWEKVRDVKEKTIEDCKFRNYELIDMKINEMQAKFNLRKASVTKKPQTPVTPPFSRRTDEGSFRHRDIEAERKRYWRDIEAERKRYWSQRRVSRDY